MIEKNNCELRPSYVTNPFLKWAGGKRWFVKNHLHETPSHFGQYFEPFLGGGSMFFALSAEHSVLADVNAELINTYQAIKENFKYIEQLLQNHHDYHSKEYYYQLRSTKYQCRFDRAAQFIYLNRTCWNALYRVNLKGEFNVPIGTKTNVILDSDNFKGISDLLKTATLLHSDFESIIDKAQCGDFIFIDPPYTVKHNNNGFVKYNEQIFSWEDQVRLAEAVIRASERGCYILLTNAYHDSVKELYNVYESFKLSKVSRKSVIAADPSNRGLYDELLVKNF